MVAKKVSAYNELNIDIPSGVNVFLISDTHFCHSNVIRYCNRPFLNVDEMNETMLKNWCRTVTNDDYVIFCGDFVLGTENKPFVSNELYKTLTGKKFMLKGNHDSRMKLEYPLYDRVLFELFGKRFVCQHYQIDPKEVGCDIAIVGHLHNSDNPENSMYILENQIVVCSELINYTPLLLTAEIVNTSKLY